MENILLFANSIAGRGRGKAIANRLSRALEGAGYRVRNFFESPQKITLEQIRGDGPAQAAIVIGGDGTLRNVVERLTEAFEPHVLPPLLIVPLGTANLMAQHLHIDWHIDWHGANATRRILAAIAERKIVNLDSARANGQLCLLVVGAGMDGHIIHEMDRIRSGPIDLASYALPVALAMHKYTYPPITVEVDGNRIFGPRPGMVFIANVAEYGTGFPIIANAKSDDGLLDICVLPCKSRGEFLDLLLIAAAGQHLEMEGARYLQGVNIRVTAAEPVPVQLDGEAGGFTPLEVELLPTKVGFIVP